VSSLSPDEIRAAAETHRDLGPEYQSAVIDSFLDKVGREIDARVDARVAALGAQSQQPAKTHTHARSGAPVAVLAITMTLGIPLSAIAVAAGQHPAGFWGLLVVWAAIAAINIAYAMRRPTSGGH
jgi:hypothetical protein